MSFETLTNQELTNFIFDLKMPETTKTNEPVLKRSRSKPKTSNPEEKKTTKPRERRSRSTSKSRSNSRKRTELKGAKLYTKKDLEVKPEDEQPAVVESTVKPGKRGLRSSSSTSNTSKLSVKAEIDSTQKPLDNSLVKEPEVSVIGQNLEGTPEQQPRYSLRKRNSPVSSDKQSNDLNVQERSISSSSPLTAQADQSGVATTETVVVPVAAKSGCMFAVCGYLKFNRKQIINLVIISVLMIIALAVINYLNENTLNNLIDKIVQLKEQFVHSATDLVINIRSKLGF